MTKVTASQYDDLLSGLRDAIASLISCRKNEIENEVRILRNSIAAVRAAKTLREDQGRLDRAVALLNRAEDTIARRLPTTLTDEQIELVAAQFGYEVTDPVIVENAKAARVRHGVKNEAYNGDQRLHWGTNRNGFFDALMLFEGNVEQEFNDGQAECDSIGRFHAAAFGED